ncbi:Kinase-interacting family protein, partial [Bienertia sinuspersici]
ECVTDVDQKIENLVQSCNKEEADTFGQRAECYYQQRPQLLSLLLDLYNAYLSLAERYCQCLHKHHNCSDHHHQRTLSFETFSHPHQDNHIEDEECQSDAESSLSYQLLTRSSYRGVLLEVLESERLILLNENAGLRYKVEALIDENKGLALESIFMRRKAGELASCVLKMREDRRTIHKVNGDSRMGGVLKSKDVGSDQNGIQKKGMGIFYVLGQG